MSKEALKNTVSSVSNCNGTSASSKSPWLNTVAKLTEGSYRRKNNLLHDLGEGTFIFCAYRKDGESPLRLKKLCDRVQYAVLPADHEDKPFICLGFSFLKSMYAHERHEAPNDAQLIHQASSQCHIQFFANIDYFEKHLFQELSQKNLKVVEILSNNMYILTDGYGRYPLGIKMLIAQSIINHVDAKRAATLEVARIEQRLKHVAPLIDCLAARFPKATFVFKNGELMATYKNVTCPIDYPTIVDDLFYLGMETSIAEYLDHFDLPQLDSRLGFPSLSLRSPAHKHNRSESLCLERPGYAFFAVQEKNQLHFPTSLNTPSASFLTIWRKRSLRYVHLHRYVARVIKSSSPGELLVAFVGEKISSVAIFPELVRGLLEAIQAPFFTRVKLLAYREDMLIVASENTSPQLIAGITEQANILLRMIAPEGSDAIVLNEPIDLPAMGFGSFKLQHVPKEFFELLDTASAMKATLPPGHEYYLRGLAYECLRESGQAIRELKKALRLDRNDADILYALGKSLSACEQWTEALPFLRRAFLKLNEDAELANSYGIACLKCGDTDSAIEAFERAVKLVPGSAEILANLGRGYLAAKRTSEAISAFNLAIKCDPSSFDAHKELAQLFNTEGDLEMAQKHALLAYKENPSDTNIANLLWHLTLQKKTETRG